jgi:flagellar motor switch protein FliN
MDGNVSELVTNCFLKGAFDVFDAMLSASFSCEAEEANPLSAELLEDAVARYPVCLKGEVQGDIGAVALLFAAPDAARIAAMVLESEPKEALDAEDAGVLQEVADPALGGGVTNVMERFNHEVAQLENIEILTDASTQTETIMDLMDNDAVIAPFRFDTGEDFAGNGALIFSRKIEALAPEDVLEEAAPAGLEEGATLSQDEMSDILSGFGDVEDAPEEMAAGTPGEAAPAGGGKAPENLDLVLDIRLEATARLGRVEMPVGAILELGPGSIVEVGHLVDEPVELLINNKLIARGDVVVVDEKFGLRITEIISPRERIESLR